METEEINELAKQIVEYFNPNINKWDSQMYIEKSDIFKMIKSHIRKVKSNGDETTLEKQRV